MALEKLVEINDSKTNYRGERRNIDHGISWSNGGNIEGNNTLKVRLAILFVIGGENELLESICQLSARQ